MIREPAARKLAHDLLDPFIKAGVASEGIVDTVTKLILSHVETDEIHQEIERLEAKKVPA